MDQKPKSRMVSIRRDPEKQLSLLLSHPEERKRVRRKFPPKDFCTEDQYRHLLAVMRNNPDMIKDKKATKGLWCQLSLDLNKLDQTFDASNQKSTSLWMAVWESWCSRTKQKFEKDLSRAQKNIDKAHPSLLTPLEMELMALLSPGVVIKKPEAQSSKQPFIHTMASNNVKLKQEVSPTYDGESSDEEADLTLSPAYNPVPDLELTMETDVEDNSASTFINVPLIKTEVDPLEIQYSPEAGLAENINLKNISECSKTVHPNTDGLSLKISRDHPLYGEYRKNVKRDAELKERRVKLEERRMKLEEMALDLEERLVEVQEMKMKVTEKSNERYLSLEKRKLALFTSNQLLGNLT